MNTIISSLEAAFYHLVSFSSFTHFLILILFGIAFQLKSWKDYFFLLLALFSGSITGLLVSSLHIISLSGTTISLLMIVSFLAVGIHNLTSVQIKANTVRYNFFALLGVVLGIGISGHYKQMFGSGFSFLSFLGYSTGLAAAYFSISLISLLLSSLALVVFKTDKKSYILIVSGIAIGIAITLICLRAGVIRY